MGLLANPAAPAGLQGLFYTGNAACLVTQALGVASVASYAAIAMSISFAAIQLLHGLRASAEDELTGLDISEHGLPSAYADFAPAVEQYAGELSGAAPLTVTGTVPPAEAVPVKKVPSFDEAGHKFTKVEIICKEERFYALKNAMSGLGITGMTVSHVMGYGMQKGRPEYYRGVAVETNLVPKVQVDIVVSAIPVQEVVDTAKRTLYTGHIGDGKIFVYDVENVFKIRTGEEGYDALQDVG